MPTSFSVSMPSSPPLLLLSPLYSLCSHSTLTLLSLFSHSTLHNYRLPPVGTGVVCCLRFVFPHRTNFSCTLQRATDKWLREDGECLSFREPCALEPVQHVAQSGILPANITLLSCKSQTSGLHDDMPATVPWLRTSSWTGSSYWISKEDTLW